MDRFQIRREVEKAFFARNKNSLCKLISSSDPLFIADVIWEYMEEARKKQWKNLREKLAGK